MKQKSKQLYAEQEMDEMLLSNKKSVDDALKFLGIDDIFNADNDDINMIDDDEFFSKQAVEEKYEKEEELQESEQINFHIAEPPQKVSPIILQIDQPNSSTLPKDAYNQLIKALNRLSESNIPETAQIFTKFQALDLYQPLLDFILSFDQNQNLTAVLAVFTYQLYVSLTRSNYNNMLKSFIQFQLSTPSLNMLEFLSFCTHWRCFPVEILINLLENQHLLQIMNSVRIASVQIQNDKLVKKVLKIIEKQTYVDIIDLVRVQILNDMLVQKQISLFKQSFLSILETEYQNIRKSATKQGLRVQCEYDYVNMDLQKFILSKNDKNATVEVINPVIYLNASLQEFNEQKISNSVLFSRFQNIISQENKTQFQNYFSLLFTHIQISPFTPIFVEIIKFLIVSAPNLNAVRGFFWDFQAKLGNKKSNQIAQISLLQGILVTAEQDQGKLENVIRGFDRKRIDMLKKDQIFWDICWMKILKEGVGNLNEAEIENFIKYGKQLQKNADDMGKIVGVVGQFEWQDRWNIVFSAWRG
ncbi:hypothetical protein SS50377_22606 [Spironucleus salmonicida]|uniref:Uncharacterized protein n=1 Tax=Spironucleus salmonicida TaxID=348837 RepID=V6LMF9_9EUKA|nr:hypothetical protein SS50377_22606 [Spironucleus salmonicida]|eukprot:EST41904.1 Hypothetical protein SS50377_18207 [Spironucleus salmonicida]